MVDDKQMKRLNRYISCLDGSEAEYASAYAQTWMYGGQKPIATDYTGLSTERAYKIWKTIQALIPGKLT